MDALLHWSEALFRWIHVVAGVMWIGHLYFFNFVNAQFAKKLDADSKPKVIPELIPRALFFFRWGAAYTWVTGILLLGLVYYMGGQMAKVPEQNLLATGAGIGAIIVGAIVYDLIWRSMQAQEQAAVGISFALVVGLILSLNYGVGMQPRALFIHVGSMFGTIMAMNVWMRIWPTQRKIIAAVKAGQAPDPAWPALAGLRSKHNTYLSVPLIYTMVSSHNAGAFSMGNGQLGWIVLVAVIVIGWGMTYRLYQISAQPSASAY